MKKLLCIFAVLLLTASCSKEAGTGGNKVAGNAGKYLAKVNGAAITEDDVTRELEALPPQVRGMFMSEGGVEGFIEELVKKELLYNEAMKKGLDKSEELKKKMEDFKKLMAIEILLEQVVEKKADVTEKEARDFYEKNKADFVLEKKGKKEVIEFDRVKELLMQRLASEKQKKLFDSYIAGLKNSYTIEFNKEAIAAFAGSGKERPQAKPETEVKP
ncbi:MAG: hypothetical protein Q8J64_05545 [Thermodesulfovibrionales bacterium]|nr:hypothetical protein [Thermodesulfovibrionales bacterium]